MHRTAADFYKRGWLCKFPLYRSNKPALAQIVFALFICERQDGILSKQNRLNAARLIKLNDFDFVCLTCADAAIQQIVNAAAVRMIYFHIEINNDGKMKH